jgi:hypothetical protein
VFLRLAALLPPLVVLGLIARLAVNVPDQDDWDTASVVIGWRQHTLGVTDLWRQHSEHRILVVRLVVWLAGILTDFNVVAEMIVGFGFALATLWFLHALINRALRTAAPELVPFLTISCSLILFSLTLHENWFTGSASLELLFYVAGVMAIWALTRWPDERRGLAIACACAVAATLTEASGLTLWVTGTIGIWLTTDANVRRRRRLTAWLIAAVLTVAAYTWGLHWGGSSMSASVWHPVNFVLFVATVLGIPFAYGSDAIWSAAVGFSGCLAIVVSALHLRRHRPDLFQSLLPLLVLGVQGLLVSVMIGLGRSSLDLRSAMASHYSIGSSLFWMATITLAAAAAHTMWDDADEWSGKAAIALPAGLAALGLACGYTAGNVAAYRDAYARSRNLEMALASLYAPTISRDALRFLYPPDDGRIHRQVDELKKWQLGPFSPRMEARHAALVQEFRGRAAGRGALGYHDSGDCHSTFGWAWDPAQPDVPIDVDVWYQGTKVGSATANWFRRDLMETGKGNGQHAFVFVFPTPIASGTGEMITITFAGTGTRLRGSPKAIMCR